MHKSLEKFEPYVKDGLIRKVISPCKRLVLFNYTDKTTYEKAWDEVTLNARGTVYEITTGRVVAKSFEKFFNMGELPTEKQKRILNFKSFTTYEKMDGSLGIIYYYDGEWRVNTRGSFTSDQAIKAKEMLNSKYDMSKVPEEVTILAEIIYPDNRIIVDYGNVEELVIIASYGRQHKELPYKYESTGMRFAPSYNFTSIEELQSHLETLDHTEEGYIVRLDTGYRVKFKSAEYLRVARIMSHMSPLAFWEKMSNGKVDLDFLEHLPEEFRDECESLAVTLENSYKNIKNYIHDDYIHVIKSIGGLDQDNLRKSIALFCKSENISVSGIFAILDKKEDVLNKIVMTKLRPTGNVIKG